MGGSCSRGRLNETGNDDSYYEDHSYRQQGYNRQSWLIYDSELTPEAPKVQLRGHEDSKKTVKEKLENIRQSWFNPESYEKEVFYDPEKKDTESRSTVKDKLSTWRRSWFGPGDGAQSKERKVSVADAQVEQNDIANSVVYRENRNKMSQSGINRLSVTRSFVQRLGQADDVYGKTSKGGTPRSPPAARRMSSEDKKEDSPKVVKALVASHSDEQADEAKEATEEASQQECSSPADVLVNIQEVEASETKIEDEDKEDSVSCDSETEDRKVTIATPPPSIDQHDSEDSRKEESEDSSKEESEDEAKTKEPDSKPQVSAPAKVTCVVSSPARFDRPRVFTGATRYANSRPMHKQTNIESDEETNSTNYKTLHDLSDSD